MRSYQLHRSEYDQIFASQPQLSYLFSLFHDYGYDIRVVGGAVRDLLLGMAPHDIDLATTATSDEMFDMIRGDSNIDHVYTRAEHFGTLTLVVGTTKRRTYQVTTLKQRIIRQGKDVHVEFTDDWRVDAHQRDLSINSLSMDEHGVIYDYTNGVADVRNHCIRFNGNVFDRLLENPIRILRYFRFFSVLASDPHSHSSEVLNAIEECCGSLENVPGEKIWMELQMILRSPLAGHVMRTMLEQQLAPMLKLPESRDGMFELENRWLRCANEQVQPMTLLVTLFDDDEELNEFCRYMRCSSHEKELGRFLLKHRHCIEPDHYVNDDCLYWYKELIVNAHSTQQARVHEQVMELLKYQGHVHLVESIRQWSIPSFPVSCWDLRRQGLMGNDRWIRGHLRELKEEWKNSRYTLSREQLIDYGFQSGLFYR